MAWLVKHHGKPSFAPLIPKIDFNEMTTFMPTSTVESICAEDKYFIVAHWPEGTFALFKTKPDLRKSMKRVIL